MAKYALRNGPFPLTNADIDANVPKGVKGVYALGPLHPNGGITVMRVGRSDTDVNGRLKWYVGQAAYKQCTHFMWEQVGTNKQGFETESTIFHDYAPKLNDIHPARPEGSTDLCPVNNSDECPTNAED